MPSTYTPVTVLDDLDAQLAAFQKDHCLASYRRLETSIKAFERLYPATEAMNWLLDKSNHVGRYLGELLDQTITEAVAFALADVQAIRDNPPPNVWMPPETLPSVDDKDIAILKALVAKYPQVLFQVDIVVQADDNVSRKTVGERLKTLIDAGLVEQPRGERGGYTITQKGRYLLAKLPAD